MDAAETPSTAEDIVRRSSFFRGLPETARQEAARNARAVRFSSRDCLIPESVAAPALLLVAEGLVRGGVTANGVEEVLHHAGPGTLLGASALGGGVERAGWIAESQVTAFAWDQAAISRLERICPGVSAQLGVALSVRDRMRELVAAIHQSPMFRHTSPVLIAELVRRSTLLRAEAGSVVFSQGDPGDALYVIVRGEVEITRLEHSHARPESLAVLWPGDVFGEMALVARAPRNATARALRESELLLVTRDDFDTLRRSCTAFQRSLEGVVSMRQSGAPEPARTELWWFSNHTPYETETVLSLLASEMRGYGDRVAVACIADDRAPKVPLRAGSMPIGSAELEERLGALSTRGDFDYVLCFASGGDGREAARRCRQRARRAVVLTEDASAPVPGAASGQEILSWVELRGPRIRRAHRACIRRGTIPVSLPVPSELRPEATATPAIRAEFARLARALTDRTVGVALGGGAAWGYAHVALLRGLLDLGIPVDMITGTSVGSMVGALYASRGVSGLDAFLAARVEIQLRAAACVVTSRPVTAFMQKRLAHARLEDLPIPFFPVAVDIDAGRERVFRQGSIGEAVRASCSLPGVFGPSDFEGRRYVDGCVTANVPVDAIIEEGADFVIASNIIPAPPHAPAKASRSGWARTIGGVSFGGRVRDSLRALFLLYNLTGERQASAADVTFSPDLNPFLPTDFVKANDIVRCAERQLEPVMRDARDKFAAFCRRSAAR